MRKISKTSLIFLILLSCIGCDQVTKNIAKQSLNQYETISILKDTFQLQYIENSGGFLRFGSLFPESIRFLLFTVLVGLFIIGMLFYLFKSNELTNHIILAFSLIIDGATGNFIDRLLYEGKVIDFLNLGIGSLRTGIFNFANFAITIGMIWFLIITMRSDDKIKKPSNHQPDPERLGRQ